MVVALSPLAAWPVVAALRGTGRPVRTAAAPTAAAARPVDTAPADTVSAVAAAGRH